MANELFGKLAFLSFLLIKTDCLASHRGSGLGTHLNNDKTLGGLLQSQEKDFPSIQKMQQFCYN